MLAEWMVYALTTSVLLGLAARLAEQALRPYRLALRWVWLGALVGSVVLPWAAWAGGGALGSGWLRLPVGLFGVPSWLDRPDVLGLGDVPSAGVSAAAADHDTVNPGIHPLGRAAIGAAGRAGA